jgi:hypothetical protein
MQQTQMPFHEAAILTRLIGSGEPVLSSAAAKGFLALGFDPVDKDRMHALAAKSREGSLTSEELAEVEAYSRISSLIGILKSRARRSLKRRSTNGKTKAR